MCWMFILNCLQSIHRVSFWNVRGLCSTCWQEAEMRSEHFYAAQDAVVLSCGTHGQSGTWFLLATFLMLLELSLKIFGMVGSGALQVVLCYQRIARSFGSWYFWSYCNSFSFPFFFLMVLQERKWLAKSGELRTVSRKDLSVLESQERI